MAKSYKEKLLDPRWQKKRLKAMERDNFTCVHCGDTESTQHVHHKKYTGQNPWDAPLGDLETVCKVCHSILEIVKKFKLSAYLKKIDKLDNHTENVLVYAGYFLLDTGDKVLGLFNYEDNQLDWVASIGEKNVSSFLKHLKALK